MLRLIVSGVLAVVSITGLFAIPEARATTAPAPAGLAAVIQQANPVEEVATACRRVWRCGPYGCGYQRQCWETGGGYGYGYGNGGYYGGRRYNTWNGCPRNWTVQDGVCKPYRGY